MFTIPRGFISYNLPHVNTVSYNKCYVVYITITEAQNLHNSFKQFIIPGRIVYHNHAHVIRVVIIVTGFMKTVLICTFCILINTILKC